MVYKGTPRRDIEPWLDRAERLGAVTAVVDLNLVLVTWRDGDLEAAERHWRRVMRLGPEVLHYWNGVKLDTPIETLPDLMAHCCAEASCGRYLAQACQDADLAVAQREIPTEVARRELLIEMERRRRLDEIYSKRRDLQIEVEPPEEVP
jgi:hypothetical protein